MGLFRFSTPQPHEHLLGRYAALKGLLRELHDELVSAIPPKTLLACARRLGMADGGDVVFGSDAEESMLFDYCLYHERIKGSTLARRYARDRLSREPAGDTASILQAMTSAAYRLMAIESIERGVGVGVRDILRDARFFVMDKMLGKTVRPDFILAGTILDLPEFSVTTGAVLPFPDKVSGLLPGLRQKPGFSEGFRQSAAAINPNDEALLAVTLIVTSKEAGLTGRVRYVDPPGNGGC
jgi:hypothetical protein